MNIKIKYAAGIFLMALLSFAFYQVGAYQGGLVAESETYGFDNWVTVRHIKGGEVVFEERVHNEIMTEGASYARNIFGFDNETVAAVKWLSLSNDASVDKTWLVLPGELSTDGLARAEDTSVTVVNQTAWEVDYTWTYTGSSQQVQCVGSHWAVSGSGNLFSALNFTPQTLTEDSQIKITYTYNVPDG